VQIFKFLVTLCGRLNRPHYGSCPSGPYVCLYTARARCSKTIRLRKLIIGVNVVHNSSNHCVIFLFKKSKASKTVFYVNVYLRPMREPTVRRTPGALQVNSVASFQ